jgi:hypothetical protein
LSSGVALQVIATPSSTVLASQFCSIVSEAGATWQPGILLKIVPWVEGDVVDFFILESDKYKIERELGRGGMGIVYLAQDLRLNRTVALKVLNEHLNRDKSFVARFHKEASLISTLYHPNVVVVHGLEKIGETYVIEMEYVDGLSIDRFGRSAQIAPPVVARIGADILEGLAACHAVGIIHRDIKPANILLNQVGTAKIVDFGLATAYAGHVRATVASKVSSGFFMGTPSYAPPAAWEGADPSPGWDLYSVGVILFELLTGKSAFPGETPMAIMRQHITAPLPALAEVNPGVSSELARIVDRLVDGSQTESLPSASEVLHSLRSTPEYQKVREGEAARTVTVAIRRHRRSAALKPWWPRLKRAASVFTVLLVGAGASYWVFSMPPGRDEGGTPVKPVNSALEDGPIFLRPVVAGELSSDNALWRVTRDEGSGGMHIIGMGEQDLVEFNLTPGAEFGQYVIGGFWGEYMTPLNGSVRYGELSGSAISLPERDTLSLAFERRNVRDGATQTSHVIAAPSVPEIDQMGFVERLESNRIVQSLLYNELLVRGLPWTEEIEQLMPGIASGRVATGPIDGTISIDGVLDDAAWVTEGDSSASPVLARWSADAVVIAMRANAPSADGRLEIALAMSTPTLQQEPEYVVVSRLPDGSIAAVHRQGNRETPWACDWEIAVARNGEEWTAEIRIPLANLAPEATPQAGRPWRINAHLVQADSGETSTFWGYNVLGAVDHGLMLDFENLTP